MTAADDRKRDQLRAIARCERYGMHDMARAHEAQLRTLDQR